MPAIHPLLAPFAAPTCPAQGALAYLWATRHNAALAEPRSGPERRTVRLLRTVADMAAIDNPAILGPIIAGSLAYVAEMGVGDLDRLTLDAALRGLAASAGIGLDEQPDDGGDAEANRRENDALEQGAQIWRRDD